MRSCLEHLHPDVPVVPIRRGMAYLETACPQGPAPQKAQKQSSAKLRPSNSAFHARLLQDGKARDDLTLKNANAELLEFAYPLSEVQAQGSLTVPQCLALRAQLHEASSMCKTGTAQFLSVFVQERGGHVAAPVYICAPHLAKQLNRTGLRMCRPLKRGGSTCRMAAGPSSAARFGPWTNPKPNRGSLRPLKTKHLQTRKETPGLIVGNVSLLREVQILSSNREASARRTPPREVGT